MNFWLWFLLVLGAILFVLVLLWLKADRSYKSSSSVASAYDNWTNDHLLESLWGEHVHLGYYGNPPLKRDFRQAKVDFVYELIRWSGLDKLPTGSRVLDVGCGIGGSTRILANDYGFDVLGVTLSPAQVRRAHALTSSGMSCKFEVMDALNLNLLDESFDGVWSVEVGPHIPDKQKFANELLRVLRPGGVLAVADWNCRDIQDGEMSWLEKIVINQLLNQWAHPKFASINEFRNNLLSSSFCKGIIESQDWTRETLPSWNESILEGFRRPGKVLGLGSVSVFKGLREIPTIMLMRWAFANGLMQFGVFRCQP